MDNLTHSLVGAALAGLILPVSTSVPARRATLAAAVVAANALDLDFAYAWITEPPLGLLLHHRGHTHTLEGGLLLGGLVLLVVRLWSWRRSDVALPMPPLVAICGLGVLSHLLIDATNVFGVVLWYPFSTRWLFGDISYIFEPWLWVMLGVPLARHASTSMRVGLLGVIAAATLTAVTWRLIPATVVPVLLGAGAAWWHLAGRVAAHSRMMMALGGAVAVFVILAVASSVSRQQLVGEAGAANPEGIVLDVVLEPDPATPWCWSGLVVSREAELGHSLRVRRGTVSLLPGLWPANSCASAKLFGPDEGAGNAAGLVWTQEWTMALARLQWLGASDCHTSAWLRFARAPMVVDGSLRDLRLENPVHDNFTTLPLGGMTISCPSNVPPWTPPRADVLDE